MLLRQSTTGIATCSRTAVSERDAFPQPMIEYRRKMYCDACAEVCLQMTPQDQASLTTFAEYDAQGARKWVPALRCQCDGGGVHRHNNSTGCLMFVRQASGELMRKLTMERLEGLREQRLQRHTIHRLVKNGFEAAAPLTLLLSVRHLGNLVLNNGVLTDSTTSLIPAATGGREVHPGLLRLLQTLPEDNEVLQRRAREPLDPLSKLRNVALMLAHFFDQRFTIEVLREWNGTWRQDIPSYSSVDQILSAMQGTAVHRCFAFLALLLTEAQLLGLVPNEHFRLRLGSRFVSAVPPPTLRVNDPTRNNAHGAILEADVLESMCSDTFLELVIPETKGVATTSKRVVSRPVAEVVVPWFHLIEVPHGYLSSKAQEGEANRSSSSSNAALPPLFRLETDASTSHHVYVVYDATERLLQLATLEPPPHMDALFLDWETLRWAFGELSLKLHLGAHRLAHLQTAAPPRIPPMPSWAAPHGPDCPSYASNVLSLLDNELRNRYRRMVSFPPSGETSVSVVLRYDRELDMLLEDHPPSLSPEEASCMEQFLTALSTQKPGVLRGLVLGEDGDAVDECLERGARLVEEALRAWPSTGRRLLYLSLGDALCNTLSIAGPAAASRLPMASQISMLSRISELRGAALLPPSLSFLTDVVAVFEGGLHIFQTLSLGWSEKGTSTEEMLGGLRWVELLCSATEDHGELTLVVHSKHLVAWMDAIRSHIDHTATDGAAGGGVWDQHALTHQLCMTLQAVGLSIISATKMMEAFEVLQPALQQTLHSLIRVAVTLCKHRLSLVTFLSVKEVLRVLFDPVVAGLISEQGRGLLSSTALWVAQRFPIDGELLEFEESCESVEVLFE